MLPNSLTNMVEIPLEVQNMIAEYLPVKDIVNLRNVSHQFREVFRCFGELPKRKEEWFYGKIAKLLNISSQQTREYILSAKTLDELFCALCSGGFLDEAKWLVSLHSTNVPNSNKLGPLVSLGGVNIHAKNDWAFRFACYYDRIDIANWLLTSGNVDIHFGDDEVFRFACYFGLIEVAKWYLSLGGVYIHAENDWAFRFACQNGHLGIAKWLYNLGGVDIHALADDTFVRSCASGQLIIVKWLLSLGGVDIHSCRDEAFRCACRDGHLDVAKWLYSLGGINIHADDDGAFRWTCEHGHLEIANWLKLLEPNYKFPEK